MGALASSSNTASADERSATEKAVFFAAIYPFGQLSPKSVDNLVDEPEKYEKTAAKTLLLLNWSEIDQIAKYVLYQ